LEPPLPGIVGGHPGELSRGVILYISRAVSGHWLFSAAFFERDLGVETRRSATALAWWRYGELNV